MAAINRGDRTTASSLAQQVLAADKGNVDAEDLLATSGAPGEIRRLTILFADLVDSTKLSTHVEPETYRLLVSRYRERTLEIISRFGGHVGSTKGDGLLAVAGCRKGCIYRGSDQILAELLSKLAGCETCSAAVEAAKLSASKSMEVPQKARYYGALLLCSKSSP